MYLHVKLNFLKLNFLKFAKMIIFIDLAGDFILFVEY